MSEPVFHDMIAAPGTAVPKPVTRGKYLACLIAWAFSAAAIPLFIVFNRTVPKYGSVVLILTVIVIGALTGSFAFDPNPPRKDAASFDIILYVVWAVTSLLFICTLIVALISGGGPDIKDGNYVLVSHNTVKRVITERAYRLFCVNEAAIFALPCCAMLSGMLLDVRKRMKKKNNG